MTNAEIVEALTEYLDGGERAGFGGRDPFTQYSGGGGAKGIAEAIAVTVDNKEACPLD